MKKILITAAGEISKHFVERIIYLYSDDNYYDIIYKDPALFTNQNSMYFKYHNFDPTSFSKIAEVFNRHHMMAFIVIDNKKEVLATYENIRRLNKNIQINILDHWGIKIKDPNLHLVSIKELGANRLVSILPNVPVTAQHIGLNKGEIMEIQVPIGSAYAHRHIHTIKQKKWKISAVYREDELLLPMPSLIIRPNDIILAIGNPAILPSVYRAIKAETGQFPAPYGRNCIYLVDPTLHYHFDFIKDLDKALYFHNKLSSKKIFIKTFSADSFKMISTLRNLNRADVEVDISFKKFDPQKELVKYIEKCNAGVVIVGNKMFSQNSIKKLLFNSKKAVLKLGNEDPSKIQRSVLLLSNNSNLEQISGPMFDVSTQMEFKISLYDFNPNDENLEDILDHFQNLSNIHSKDISIIKNRSNPIRELAKRENILQFLPFEKSVTNTSFYDIFLLPDIEKQSKFLSKFNQIYIPIEGTI